MGDVDNLRSLTAELTDLRMEMMREEASTEGRIAQICELHRGSAFRERLICKLRFPI